MPEYSILSVNDPPATHLSNGASASPSLAERPFTPESLAARWDCSAEKVRTMCRKNELRHFKLGKLIRVPAIEVERIECQTQNTDSLSTGDSSPLQPAPALPYDEFRLARMI